MAIPETDSPHAQLVASLKSAENEAKNGETFFLVELLTAATFDNNPRHSLRDIYEALMDAKTWLLLDALNLLPLLIPSGKDAASEMLLLIAQKGNPKEIIISVQELLERLDRDVVKGETSGLKPGLQLIRLLDVCRESIPRIQPRKKNPAETYRPVLVHLGSAIEGISSLFGRDDGRNLISSVSSFIQNIIPCFSQSNSADTASNQTLSESLMELLYMTLGTCANHIRAAIARRRFEEYNPRFALQPAASSDSQRGEEVINEALGIVRTLGVTPSVLVSEPLSLGKLILIAHQEPSTLAMSSDQLQKLIPVLTSSLQQNIAVDESLAFLLVFLSTSTYQLPQEVVDPLVTLITPLASTHPDPSTRFITFRILADLLSRAPPPVHLAHLSSLISDCPFPQMRVAAVGLVKEAFLNAVSSENNEPSPFRSTALVRTLGATLFRPDPPDLFVSPTKRTLRKFLESCEPARLTECLAFCYVLLKRDTANHSGIRDRDVLNSVENSLLAPLRNALAVWLEESTDLDDRQVLMPIASLETSLERVDEVVNSLGLSR